MKTYTDWRLDVADYIDDLTVTKDALIPLMEGMRIREVEKSPEEIEHRAALLQARLKDLEAKIISRQKLLERPDAPPVGHTLIEKLDACKNPEATALARDAEQLSQQIDAIQTQSISLFVCQFHLFDWTNQVMRTVTNVQTAETYSSLTPAQQANAQRSVVQQSTAPGRLFDDAA